MLIAPSSWRLLVRSNGDATFLHFNGTSLYLHEGDAERLRGCLAHLGEKARNVHFFLDLGNVIFLTSSTVEALLALRRRLLAQSSRLSICNLTPTVREIFSTLKLDHILDIRPGPVGGLRGD